MIRTYLPIEHPKFTSKYTKVFCEDAAEQLFNAPHHFKVVNVEDGSTVGRVDFQEGPIKEVGINGITEEDLLLMIIARLESFQCSEFKCIENEEAIVSLREALISMNYRKAKRIKRGVEGTNNI